ncbi:MAG: hypothetical protein H7Y28_00640, partial [Rhodoferax sp.]|nr:hypothetical protein [Rhodoferax sp.]
MNVRHFAIVWLLFGVQGLHAQTANTANTANTTTACSADPLGGRSLYLRGSFNGWAAPDAQRFAWGCNQYQLVTRLDGEHSFKVGDEGWSTDADFGAGKDAGHLAIKGKELKRRFA